VITDDQATANEIAALKARVETLFGMIVSLQHCIEPMLTEYNRKMEGMPVGLRDSGSTPFNPDAWAEAIRRAANFGGNTVAGYSEGHAKPKPTIEELEAILQEPVNPDGSVTAWEE
jgi:hypothetical protein